MHFYITSKYNFCIKKDQILWDFAPLSVKRHWSSSLFDVLAQLFFITNIRVATEEFFSVM